MSPAKLSTASPELSPVQVTAQCNGLCEFSAFSLAPLAFLDCSFSPPPPLSAAFLSSPSQPQWGCRCHSPVPGPVGLCCSMVLLHPFVTTHKCSSLCPPLLCAAFQDSSPAFLRRDSCECQWRAGLPCEKWEKFQSLSMYFLGKY